MKVIETGKAVREYTDLKSAIKSLNFYVSPMEKLYAEISIEEIGKAELSYGFASATITK